jgi:ribosomal 50S subunit-recycling heat shock protein
VVRFRDQREIDALVVHLPRQVGGIELVGAFDVEPAHIALERFDDSHDVRSPVIADLAVVGVHVNLALVDRLAVRTSRAVADRTRILRPPEDIPEVRIGDRLRVRNDTGEFVLEVLLLSEIRGPAAVAQTLYRETDASRELRLKLAEERKMMMQSEGAREGRPSKRDRREIGRLRGRL